MALRFPSGSDIRLFVGGDPVHGEDAEERTLRTLARAGAHMDFPYNTIGDADDRFGYLIRRNGSMSVTGLWDDRFGLHPMLAAATPGNSNEGLPVTASYQGTAPGTRSVIAEHGIWSGAEITSSDDAPVMVAANCKLSGYATALCIGEARLAGGGRLNLNAAGLSLRSRGIPVVQSTNVLTAIDGDNQFSFQVEASVARQYLAEDEAVEFPGSRITGIFYIATLEILPGVRYATVVVERRPRAVLSAFSIGDRRSVRTVSVISQQTGRRAALVHVADVRRQDRTRLEVELRGQAAGSAVWTPVVPAVTLDIPASPQDQHYRRGIWFDIPEGTHSDTAIQVQIRFVDNSGNVGGRPDYAASVRADFAPRFLFHA